MVPATVRAALVATSVALLCAPAHADLVYLEQSRSLSTYAYADGAVTPGRQQADSRSSTSLGLFDESLNASATVDEIVPGPFPFHNFAHAGTTASQRSELLLDRIAADVSSTFSAGNVRDGQTTATATNTLHVRFQLDQPTYVTGSRQRLSYGGFLEQVQFFDQTRNLDLFSYVVSGSYTTLDHYLLPPGVYAIDISAGGSYAEAASMIADRHFLLTLDFTPAAPAVTPVPLPAAFAPASALLLALAAIPLLRRRHTPASAAHPSSHR